MSSSLQWRVWEDQMTEVRGQFFSEDAVRCIW